MSYYVTEDEKRELESLQREMESCDRDAERAYDDFCDTISSVSERIQSEYEQIASNMKDYYQGKIDEVREAHSDCVDAMKELDKYTVTLADDYNELISMINKL